MIRRLPLAAVFASLLATADAEAQVRCTTSGNVTRCDFVDGAAPTAAPADLAAAGRAVAQVLGEVARTPLPLPARPHFSTCAAARAAGAAPLRRGEPGYRPPLDRDGDGVACEPYQER